MKKSIVLFILLGLLHPAMGGQTEIQNSVCDATNAMQTTIGAVIIGLILVFILLAAIGILIYFTKKNNKKWRGISLFIIAASVILIILGLMIYLMMPAVIGTLTGVNMGEVCG